jgi:hypothetical protein
MAAVKITKKAALPQPGDRVAQAQLQVSKRSALPPQLGIAPPLAVDRVKVRRVRVE